jgi:hypothetical protein
MRIAQVILAHMHLSYIMDKGSVVLIIAERLYQVNE